MLNIGIIDIFCNCRSANINSSTKVDVPHGDVVYPILECSKDICDVNIKKYKVRPQQSPNPAKNDAYFNYKSLLKQLKRINQSEDKLDILNISSGYMAEYDALKSTRNKNLSDVFSQSNIERIRNELPNTIQNIIAELEKIINKGTRVYTIAGNYADSFNAYSLSKGIITVGASDRLTKKPLSYFSNNPTVNEYIPMPIYIGQSKVNDINICDKISKNHPLSSLPFKELRRRAAKEEDYVILKNAINSINAKIPYDYSFLYFYLPRELGKKGHKNFADKIFDINKYIALFENKLTDEVLENTKPLGTHCDLQFRMFFDLTNKKRPHIPLKKTTKIKYIFRGCCPAVPMSILNHLKSLK